MVSDKIFRKSQAMSQSVLKCWVAQSTSIQAVSHSSSVNMREHVNSRGDTLGHAKNTRAWLLVQIHQFETNSFIEKYIGYAFVARLIKNGSLKSTPIVQSTPFQMRQNSKTCRAYQPQEICLTANRILTRILLAMPLLQGQPKVEQEASFDAENTGEENTTDFGEDYLRCFLCPKTLHKEFPVQ